MISIIDIVEFLVFSYQRIQKIFLSFFKQTIQKTLKHIFRKGGITFNGNNPWDIQVKNDKLYQSLANKPSVGVYAYIHIEISFCP